jgi:hypothetical protein
VGAIERAQIGDIGPHGVVIARSSGARRHLAPGSHTGKYPFDL